MIIPQNSEFNALRCDNFIKVQDADAFQKAHRGQLVIEPDGEMIMPMTHITWPLESERRFRSPMLAHLSGNFPRMLHFPAMALSVVSDAYCLPFAPPFVLEDRIIITDYMIPWAPEALGWFEYDGVRNYRSSASSINTDRTEHHLGTALYLDHSVSGHFGHFLADCLPRLHAWDVCRALFGTVKVVLAGGGDASFHTHLLNALGVPSRDIVRLTGLIRCN